MSALLGNLLAGAVVLIVLLICGKNVIAIFKGELSGKGCAGCSGGCSCHCNDSSCSGSKTDKK